MEITPQNNKTIKTTKFPNNVPDITEPIVEMPSSIEESTQETVHANASLLRSYAGIKGDYISREKISDYLKSAGVKNENIFDRIIAAISDSDGIITETAFNYLQIFLPKTNIFQVGKFFEKAKEETGINYKALKALDFVIAKLPAHEKSRIDFSSFLDCIKDNEGKFNNELIDIILNSSRQEELQKAYIINKSMPEKALNSLKDNKGLFDSLALKYLKNELSNSQKSFLQISQEIISGKNENGEFSPKRANTNSHIKSLFKDYQYDIVRNIYNSIPENETEEQEKFINFAKSINNDNLFASILKLIDLFKNDKEGNLGFDYDEKTYEFLKKFNDFISFREEKFINAIKALNKPLDEYTEEEIEKVKSLMMNVYDADVVTSIINSAKIGEGINKGKIDLKEIYKAQIITAKTGHSSNDTIIKELAKCLSKEEDNEALDLLYRLYNYKFTEQKDSKDFFSHIFGIYTSFDNSVIHTITKFLCENNENGNPKHSIDKNKLNKLKSIIPENAKSDIRNSIQNKLFCEALSIPYTTSNDERYMNMDIDELCQKVLQYYPGEKIKAFRDFLIKKWNNTEENFFVEVNPNIKSRINIETGNAFNPEIAIFDIEKGKPVSESYQAWDNGYEVNVTEGYEDNTEVEQYYKYEKKNGLPYKFLHSQVVKRFDEKRNLLSTEIVKQSPIENVFDIQMVYPNGQVKDISKAVKTPQGTEIIEKTMPSFDGTITKYRYEDDPEGNRILDYKIVDENGKTILNHSVSFEIIDKNHFVSTRNQKSFDIFFDKNNLYVTNKQTGEKAVFDLYQFTKDSELNIVQILKKIPGDELFSMNELELKNICKDNNVKNAEYSNKKISVSDDFIDIAVILHEWGHGKDYLMFDKIQKTINDDPKLNEIYNYERDLFIKNMNDSQLSLISYFTADHHYLGDKAIAEGIAETNSVLSVSPKNLTQNIRAHYWQQYFPKTIAYLSKILM